MRVEPLALEGAYEVTLEPRRDERGYFMRTYDEELFRDRGLVRSWVQENQALSVRKGIVRGLHFQRPPRAETKLVRVARGAVLDVFVDLRRSSPTYGRWHGLELSADNCKAVLVPRGFAHGYCTLTDESVVLYKVDAPYSPEHEGGLRWDDPDLAIAWPTRDAIVSAKDSALALFRGFESPFD